MRAKLLITIRTFLIQKFSKNVINAMRSSFINNDVTLED
jgi:hypothetical protein